jgi:hypothetical protein
MNLHIIIGALIIATIAFAHLTFKNADKTGEEAMTSIFPAIGACACIASLLAIATFHFLRWLF